MTPVKYEPASSPFSLAGWELPYGDLSERIESEVSEWITNTVLSDEAGIIADMGSPPDHEPDAPFDPDSIRIYMPIFAGAEQATIGPIFNVGLSDMIDIFIDCHVSRPDMLFHDAEAVKAQAMADHLRHLAARIEASIAPA